MSENSRYEEMDQQFNDLPLPDQEASWQKMKEMLDKDDDDDRILPPVLLRSCMGWGILLLVGLTIAWLLVRPDKWWSESSRAKQTSSKQSSSKQTSPLKDTKNSTETNPSQKNQSTPNHEKKEIEPKVVSAPDQKENDLLKNPDLKTKGNIPVTTQNIVPKKKEKDRSQVRKPFNDNSVTTQGVKPDDVKITSESNRHKTPDTAINITDQQQVPVLRDTTQITMRKDTAAKETAPKPKDSTNQKKTKQPQKKIFLTAGIGEQQQIPIAGQTAVPYSHYGRKGSLSDYIPSVYVRLQNENKWFVQGEFRYGGAQSVKEFSYSRKTDYDTTNLKITTTTERLKKTYYHQLPLSFNYYLKPNLSVGIGGMYSRFYSAITEQETKIQNVSTGTETIYKQIIPIKHFTDSFLYKTQVHVLAQADYQWKKFSFGLRYTKDMQPYIKFTRPDGTVDEEKNQSLQLIIRYRLLKSKKMY